MPVDLGETPVAKLCARGMEAEVAEGPDAARRLFEQAWEIRSDDLEAAVAAHYLARQQPTLAEARAWNERALTHAEAAAAAGDARVAGFFPSLHLNLGRSHEDLGDAAGARRQYELALSSADALGDDGYGAMIRRGVEAALARVAPPAR